jgi:dihydroorotase-like cyclic amidohydrolase
MKLLDAMHQGLISLEDLVRITSYDPAQRFGLYPKKGVLAAGSDADLVMVDVDATHTISDDEVLSVCGWTPYRDQTVRGVPRATMLRGRMVMRDFKILVEPGFGQMAKPVGS